MQTKMCQVCQKKISLLSRIISINCNKCKLEGHNSCLKSVLDLEYFQVNAIKAINLCPSCAEEYAGTFNEKRFCSKCGKDIVIGHPVINCERCKIIGHDSCFNENANVGNRLLHFLNPYIYQNKNHTNICFSCLDYFKNEASAIEARISNWRGSTEGPLLQGYKIEEEVGNISFETEWCNLKEIKEEIILRSCQLGGNACVNINTIEKEGKIHKETYFDKRGQHTKTRKDLNFFFTTGKAVRVEHN
jgi:hypothetical protein